MKLIVTPKSKVRASLHSLLVVKGNISCIADFFLNFFCNFGSRFRSKVSKKI